MDKIFLIALWELKKIFGNWKKALAVFLLPAALMMGALNLFPKLVDYLTTGVWGNHDVIIANAPDSFRTYIDSIEGATVYKFKYMSVDEAKKLSSEETSKMFKSGTLVIAFGSDNNSFDDNIRNYYKELQAGTKEATCSANIYVHFDENSATQENNAIQLRETIVDPYLEQLPELLGDSENNYGSDMITVNGFNPVNKLLDYRTSANSGAARVLPGLMLLLMYYCTYSLTSDIFAAERERGFYNKLILSPVSRKNIFLGKISAIVVIVSTSALITFVMMFFSSWLNTSNDSMSLLPFGMFLTPGQLLIVVLELIPAAILMAMVTTNIVFNTTKIQVTIMCLQFPLVLFLFEFFIQMFRWSRPIGVEMLIPLHNTIEIIRNVFASEETIVSAVVVILVNIGLAIHIFKKTLGKELSK